MGHNGFLKVGHVSISSCQVIPSLLFQFKKPGDEMWHCRKHLVKKQQLQKKHHMLNTRTVSQLSGEILEPLVKEANINIKRHPTDWEKIHAHSDKELNPKSKRTHTPQ